MRACTRMYLYLHVCVHACMLCARLCDVRARVCVCECACVCARVPVHAYLQWTGINPPTNLGNAAVTAIKLKLR